MRTCRQRGSCGPGTPCRLRRARAVARRTRPPGVSGNWRTAGPPGCGSSPAGAASARRGWLWRPAGRPRPEAGPPGCSTLMPATPGLQRGRVAGTPAVAVDYAEADPDLVGRLVRELEARAPRPAARVVLLVRRRSSRADLLRMFNEQQEDQLDALLRKAAIARLEDADSEVDRAELFRQAATDLASYLGPPAAGRRPPRLAPLTSQAGCMSWPPPGWRARKTERTWTPTARRTCCVPCWTCMRPGTGTGSTGNAASAWTWLTSGRRWRSRPY